LVKVESNGKWELVDKTGKKITLIKYDSIGTFSEDGFARVKLNGKAGLIDKTAKEIIPCIYDNMDVFLEDGLARVELNGKAGLIDKTGKEITPCIYDSIGDFSKNGLAEVTLNGKTGFIDKSGTEVASVSLETIEIDTNDNSYYTIIYKDKRPNDVPEEIYNKLLEVQKEVINNFTYYDIDEDIDKLYGKHGKAPEMITKKDFYRHGKGVCRHFVKFFYILAQERGLTENLYIVAGKKNKYDKGHTWLEYRTEKNIYIIDPTWSGSYAIPINVARRRFIKSKAYGKNAFFITYTESEIIFEAQGYNHSSYKEDFTERVLYIDMVR